MATICCASTSSGLRRKRVDSTTPSCMARVTAAQGDEVGAVFGKDDAFARRAHVMPSPADALHGAGYGRRRLNLHHQIDRAHIDAQLERRGRDQRAQAPGLQLLFDLGALGDCKVSRGARGPTARPPIH